MTNPTPTYWLRPGQTGTDLTESYIKFDGIDYLMTINNSGDAEVRKIGANKKVGKSVAGRGSFAKHPSSGTENMPDIQGSIVIKDAKYDIVGWYNEKNGDTFYALKVTAGKVRKGKFPAVFH